MSCFAITWAVAVSASAALPLDERPYELMLGDAAPPLSVRQWVQGAPVPKFEPGRVYVIDFWATWCGPCIDAIPGLTSLQKKHSDKVTVIGVDVWDYPDRVKPFVEKMGQKMTYRVAVDDVPPVPAGTENVPLFGQQNGKTSKAWMNASGWSEAGIPTIFVVDQNGKIAWIGDNLTQLESALGEIIAGKWDLKGRAGTYLKETSALKRNRELQKEMDQAMAAKDWEKALGIADTLIASSPENSYLNGFKFDILLLRANNRTRAIAFAREQLQAGNDMNVLAQIGYLLAFKGGKLTPEELDLTNDLASRANDLAKGERGGPLETLARVAFLRGDRAKAVELQERAIAKTKTEGSRKEAEKRLAEYKAGG